MTLKASAALIFAVYVIGFTAHTWHLRKTVYGDGIFYYAWLRSVVVDHDIYFANDYAHEPVTQPKTKSGAYGNKYSIGPALFWAPPYLAVHQIVRGNGWELPYQMSAGMVSVAAAVFGIALLPYLFRTSSAISALTLLLTAGGTNLLFYGSIDVVNSHALSFFCAAVLLVLITRKQTAWFAVGITLALLASVRLQDLVYCIALIPLRTRIRWVPLTLGFSLAFLPQLAAWYALYGSFANPYIVGGETFDLLHPHILGVLFSRQSGLFLWTPMAAVGIAGLLLHARKYWTYLLIIGVQLYLVASWSTWWQGASVSGRMFVSTIPLIAVGLSEVTAGIYSHRLLRPILPHLIFGVSVLNGMGILYYLISH